MSRRSHLCLRLAALALLAAAAIWPSTSTRHVDAARTNAVARVERRSPALATNSRSQRATSPPRTEKVAAAELRDSR